jgi:shikimate kinase
MQDYNETMQEYETSIPATRGDSSSMAVISPAQHAVLDYLVAGAFISAGLAFLPRHRPAATLAFLNGAMVLGMSLLTDYPGGLRRTLSFKGHRTGDVIQAALAGLGPALFGFARDPEAKYFYSQAASEVGVIAATDWEQRSQFS